MLDYFYSKSLNIIIDVLFGIYISLSPIVCVVKLQKLLPGPDALCLFLGHRLLINSCQIVLVVKAWGSWAIVDDSPSGGRKARLAAGAGSWLHLAECCAVPEQSTLTPTDPD